MLLPVLSVILAKIQEGDFQPLEIQPLENQALENPIQLNTNN